MAEERDKLKSSIAGKGVYPAAQAGWLLHPLRRFIMSPTRVVGRLQLKPADSVLEIGPGPGWFSPEIARTIPQGRLVLVDIQRGMLDMAELRLRQNGAANAEYIETPLRPLAKPTIQRSAKASDLAGETSSGTG